MEVRAGIDPRHQDDNVRFRTTYYFRVFDVCRDGNGRAASGAPKLDSLYRFRMTGKASAFFSKVRFESGILHKSEIEPFGSTVVFDKNLERPRFVSREETDAAARRSERHEEIKRMMRLLKDMEKFAAGSHDDAVAASVAEIIGKLGKKIEEQVTNISTPTGTSPADEPGEAPGDRQASGARCPEGTELQRGFQIMGPEGMVTFNQDQRLIMAMTSSGKPLISALKELSGRMLVEHASASDVLLPLVREELATLRAERALDRLETVPDVSVSDTVERILSAFNQDVSQEPR